MYPGANGAPAPVGWPFEASFADTVEVGCCGVGSVITGVVACVSPLEADSTAGVVVEVEVEVLPFEADAARRCVARMCTGGFLVTCE
jgi:hypothetical protein